MWNKLSGSDQSSNGPSQVHSLSPQPWILTLELGSTVRCSWLTSPHVEDLDSELFKCGISMTSTQGGGGEVGRKDVSKLAVYITIQTTNKQKKMDERWMFIFLTLSLLLRDRNKSTKESSSAGPIFVILGSGKTGPPRLLRQWPKMERIQAYAPPTEHSEPISNDHFSRGNTVGTITISPPLKWPQATSQMCWSKGLWCFQTTFPNHCKLQLGWNI